MDPAGHQVSRWQRNRDQPLIRIASAGSPAALLDGPRRRITPAKLASRWLECQPEGPIGIERDVNVAYGSWLRKNVSERSKATSDWLASTLRRADWLFLRLRGLETLLKLPEVILSDLETLALMSSWGWQRQAASFMAN